MSPAISVGISEPAGHEKFVIHLLVDDEWRCDGIVAQTCDEDYRLPVAVRRVRD
jgi:hypothetical protein